MRRKVAATGVIGVLVLGACGEDDRLSEQETARAISDAVAQVSGQFGQQLGPVFEQLGRLPEGAPVPAAVRRTLEQPAGELARQLRATATEIEELAPPQDAEDEVDALAAAARQQADRLEQLPQDSDLTVRELADAVAPPVDAIQRLQQAGIDVQLPQQPE